MSTIAIKSLIERGMISEEHAGNDALNAFIAWMDSQGVTRSLAIDGFYHPEILPANVQALFSTPEPVAATEVVTEEELPVAASDTAEAEEEPQAQAEDSPLEEVSVGSNEEAEVDASADEEVASPKRKSRAKASE